ncbi:nitrilase-related carbon-nitrogen hydrolase [Colwellia sp. C1TZA3]|uniref:nitrilase-related carbon-nitrogen hydrolase n=1 Tax=Colwellia sp. C1TZA3 TaxID=2508879 RepID=UPI0011B9FD6F|nr:nitrilase-related carbon-nitrogen hydrolase [Colwellia sp. C1TZA3]TWX71374.1 carbon-nitrogen hydrolase [Colwellia sp. C1TZA3]
MRIAVSQFATVLNVQENLASCVRMINQAAVCEPSLIVLPEFCNTQFSSAQRCNNQPSYVDHNQAWHQALAIDGDFLQQIAQQAKKHHCYIMLNVTLRQDLTRDHQNPAIRSNISVTSCIFSPFGELIQQADKQALIGQENDFFISTNKVSAVVTSPFGQLGFLTGSDGVTFAVARAFALGGAQLLCNSQSSFALDQSHLHDFARAGENNIFVATANKIGPLRQQELSQERLQGDSQEQQKYALAESGDLLKQSSRVEKYPMGVGQSQIVSPNGKVLAKLDHNEEGFVFADIDLAEAGLSKKLRPDGTKLIKQRRPDLYQEQKLALQKVIETETEKTLNYTVPETANVAIFATYKSNQQAIEDVCHYIENNLSDIIQLPELFFIADKTITTNTEQLNQVACLCTMLIKQISAVLRPFQYVCTSLVIDGTHQAVLINEQGLFATQQQLHFCQRYQWTVLGDKLKIIELPLEQGVIKVAMLTGDDANIPEMVKLAALNNIQVLLVPFDIQEASEVEYSLLSRAAEHKICIVAASREKSFIEAAPVDSSGNNRDTANGSTSNKRKVKQQKSTGLIANVSAESALLSPWQSDKFNGYINKPLVKYQHGKITKAVIHPSLTLKIKTQCSQRNMTK